MPTKRGIAVVTGGTGALGRAVVKRFVADGFAVHVPWVVEAEVPQLRKALGAAAAHVALHRADLADPAAVDGLFAAACAGRKARLAVLACLAGGFVWAPLPATEPGAWRRMLDMNATSVFLCAKAAAARMKSGGRIVTVAAMPAVGRGAANLSAYSASKAAALNLTLSLSEELRPRGITVNAIAPTIMDTPANRTAMRGADRSGWLKVDDVAKVISFLAGPDAGIVTGSCLTLAR